MSSALNVDSDVSRDAHAHFWNNRIVVFDIVSSVIVSLFVIIPQVYLAENPQVNLNSTFLVETVIVPTLLATGLFLGGKRRILWFAFMAYIWSVTDDAPVYLDSIFTWPEVTSGLQHVFLEILFHILTLAFMALTIREAFRLGGRRRADSTSADAFSDAAGARKNNWRILMVLSLGLLALIASYAQNLPLDSLESISGAAWYRLDVAEHVISLGFLYAAVKLAMNG